MKAKGTRAGKAAAHAGDRGLLLFFFSFQSVVCQTTTRHVIYVLNKMALFLLFRKQQSERNEAFGVHDQTRNYQKHRVFTGFSGGRDKQKTE